MTTSEEILRGQTLAALFARGALPDIIARHLRNAASSAEDCAAVVGAYAWSGRLDEALAQHHAFASEHRTQTYRELANCYLVIGMCHAGELTRARTALATWLQAPLVVDSALHFYRRHARAFVAYFVGRMARCTRHAKHALAIAVTHRNAFGQLLANDLLGHAAFHLGNVRHGQRLLGHAIHLAAELNLGENHLNMLSASRVLAVVARPAHAVSVVELTKILRESELGYFAKRHGYAALSIAASLRGEIALAREMRQLASEYAAGDGDDARSRIRLLVADACQGAALGCAPRATEQFADALDLARRGRHVDLFAEAAFLRRLVLGVIVNERECSTAIARADIARLCWARGDAPDPDANVDDDLLAIAQRAGNNDPAALGLLGLLGATFPAGNIVGISPAAIAVRSSTAVTWLAAPSNVTVALLTALASGPRSKAELVKALWGLRVYHPAIHNGALYTAVSRVRRAWGAQGIWIENTTNGYQLAPGVTVIQLEPGAAALPQPTRQAVSLADTLAACANPPDGVTCADAARANGLSPSTALRVLRQLVSSGQLKRVGKGSATRFVRAR